MAVSMPTQGYLQRLRRTRGFARVSMFVERLWPLILPLLIVTALYLTVAWFGIFRIVPDWARISLATAFAIAALAALWPLTRFRLPGATEIDRRIEQVNELLHTPVSAQTDALAGRRDPFAEALWREHKQRIAAGLDHLSGGFPQTGIAKRDPWGMRAAVALLVVTAFSFSHGAAGGGIFDALRQHDTSVEIPPRIDAWVTPPAYTGKAPIFMTGRANADLRAYSVPFGSVVSLRATGASSILTLGYADGDDNAGDANTDNDADPTRPAGPQQFEITLNADGTLELKSGESVLDSWSFTIIVDQPPSIRFAGEPKRALNGTLELSYIIKDDYGASGARAIFEQSEPQDAGARPLYEAPEFSLRLPRRGAKITEYKTSKDLTEHPWAGTSVTARLSVTDDAGQEAFSEDRLFILPERAFSNPLARAVIEQRRILALDANKKRRVLDLIDAVTLRPEDTFKNMAHFLPLSSARSRLKMARTDDELRDVVDYLWEIALGIEDGDLSAAEKRLRQAQEALRQALEDGATDEEIEQLMAELREAMNEYLRELAERAMRDPNFSQQMQPGQEMRQSDLDKLLDQIEQLAKSGARDKAQELLSQLQDMMNNMQAGRQNGQQNGQGQMREQMNQLGEIMRRQQELMNETFRMDQQRRGQRGRGQQDGQQGQQGNQRGERPGNGQGGEQPGENGLGGMSPQELAEALRQLQEGQGQLQGQLGELLEGLRGLGIKPDENFDQAGREMGRAGEALGEGNEEQALGNQGAALEALRRGAEDMMSQMQQAMQGDSAGSQLGSQNRGDRDPLGRPQATTGPDFGETVAIPDQIDTQRAREILEAIRKRLGNALSPELERQYLERLLDLQ